MHPTIGKGSFNCTPITWAKHTVELESKTNTLYKPALRPALLVVPCAAGTYPCALLVT